MISIETFEKLGKQYQMGVFPNIVREYFQHIFLSELYKLPDAQKLLFKGGTALKIVYGSPRFSEDLDFSLFGVAQSEVKSFIEGLFAHVLAEMERAGIKVELGDKIGATSGGYFGVATFRMFEYPPVSVEINVSSRNGQSVIGEVDSVANNFVPTYTIIHLPQKEIVDEKIFGALLGRKKPRDFYDLYIIMRKGMLSLEQKKKLGLIKNDVVVEAKKINFKNELGAFLPIDQQGIIRDFSATLERELNSQLSGA
ncbi:nucleotidyl transferase AbiEii/AbiGii toxin family protein [Patescibacteria group bacterium]|nr:nucleotidyl transferase AbiEii/AbiGii toxin family protein [Patescibacteria group bacterium]MBU4458907.1 nucleotidyl transferase AbiEii/AbiGii toxin family protein [Patescibacteria group bacterium]